MRQDLRRYVKQRARRLCEIPVNTSGGRGQRGAHAVEIDGRWLASLARLVSALAPNVGERVLLAALIYH